jgi:endo-1,4-beta-xylanase
MDRRRFLAQLSSATAGIVGTSVGVGALDGATSGHTVEGESLLRDLAKAKGLIFGASTKRPFVENDAAYSRVLEKACNFVAPEVELHWEFVSPRPTIRDYRNGDWMFAFAKERTLRVRGQTLVWHRRVAPWFGGMDAGGSTKAMAGHVSETVARYRGRVLSWDVVNEAIEPRDGRRDGLRVSPLLNQLGDRYIGDAFRSAATADPAALRILNEYGFEYESGPSLARRKALLRLLERLKRDSVPVDALGAQSHLKARGQPFREREYRTFLAEVAAMGLKIFITELDVDDRLVPAGRPKRDQEVADVYRRYLDVVLDEPTSTVG